MEDVAKDKIEDAVIEDAENNPIESGIDETISSEPISNDTTNSVDASTKLDEEVKPEEDTPILNDENEEFLSTIKADECALITSLVARKIVMPIVKLAVRLGLSANAVTIFGGLSWIISLFTIVAAAQLFVLGHHIYSSLLLFYTAFLWVWGYLLDVVDGSLSRYYGTSSRRGFYLDYVFHLLFKPGFVISIGIALSVLNQSATWLYFAILALAANWTCAESSSEHVLCQEVGKGRLDASTLTEETRYKVFVGTTDIQAKAEEKKKNFFKMCYTLLKEILNYYGQSVFFAFVAIIDLLIVAFYYMFKEAGPFVWNWKLLTWSYLILFSVLILRVPFRIYREYKRMKLLDDANK